MAGGRVGVESRSAAMASVTLGVVVVNRWMTAQRLLPASLGGGAFGVDDVAGRHLALAFGFAGSEGALALRSPDGRGV